MNWERKFYRGTLSNSAEELYECPPNKMAIVTSIDVVNREGATIYLYVYLVPENSSPGVAHILIDELEIPVPITTGKQHYSWRGFQVVDNGPGTIHAYADDGSSGSVDCTISISGVEKTVKTERGAL